MEKRFTRKNKKNIHDDDNKFKFIGNETGRKLAVKLSQFMMPAAVILVDALDVILDTLYYQKLQSRGDALNEYLHIPDIVFYILFGCLMLTTAELDKFTFYIIVNSNEFEKIINVLTMVSLA